MLSEDEKKRRLALLQQQQGLSPFQKSMQQVPTAQQVQRQIFPTAIRNVPSPEAPVITQAVKAVLPSYVRLGRGFGEVLGEITGVNERARQAQLQSLRQGTEAIKTLQQRMASPTATEAQRQRDRELINKIANIDIQTAQQMQNIAQQQIERANPVKGAAAVGMVGLDVLTGGALAPGARAALGVSKLGPVAGRAATIGGGAVGGATYGALGAVEQKGAEVTPTELAQSAGIGGAIGAAIPATLGIFGRLVRPVQRLIGRETAQQTEQRLAAEARRAAEEQAARRAAAERPKVPTPAEVPTPQVRFAPRRAAPVSDAVVNQIVTKKSAADIEKTIKEIFPNIDTPSFNTAVQEINKSATKEEVKKVLDGLAEIKKTIDESIPSRQIPVTGTQITTAKLAEEIAQPTGATRITQAPTQPQVARETTALPSQMGKEHAAGVKVEKERYSGLSTWRKIKNVWDPRGLAYESDRYVNKLYKAQGKKLPPDQSMYNAIGRMVNFEPQAQQYLVDSGINKILGKYANNPDFDLYLKFKRNIESVDNGGAEFIIQSTPVKGKAPVRYSLEKQREFIQWYEKQNPEAFTDSMKLSKALYNILTEATFGPNRFIDPADFARVTKNANGTDKLFYTPFKRVMPEETLRSIISGLNVGNIARQTVLRESEVGAQQALDSSLQAVYDYIRNLKIQEGRVRVNRIFADRVAKGQIADTRFIFTGEQIAQKQAAKETLKQINKDAKALANRVKISSRQMRRLSSEINKLQREGMKEAIKTAGKPGFKLTPSGRVPSTKKIFESLIKEDSANLVRIRNKIATREPKLASKIDEVLNAKSDLEVNQINKQQVKSDISDIVIDSATGLQTINGIDDKGRQYKIEVPPEWANLLMGYDKQRTSATYKALQNVMGVAKAPIIGLNAPFQLNMTLMNMLMAPVYSDLGFKLWNPLLIKTFVQALNDNSPIVQMARRAGGVSFSGNLTKLQSDTFIEALGAQHNLVNKMKWYNPVTPKGFMRSYNKLMEFTGRLDRATRAIGFKAAYNRAKSRNLPEEQRMAAGLEAWNTVIPDFSNVADAIKQIDIVATFLAPTQASIRGMEQSVRKTPIRTLSTLAALTTPFAVITAYNFQQDKMKEFYQDMKNAKKDYIINNNLIYTLPWEKVYKDEKTGEWYGIHKMPIPPELRPLTEGITQGMLEQAAKNNIPIETYAKAVFGFLTGKVWDISNPVYQHYMAISSGKDVRTGRDIWDSTMTDDQKREAIIRYLINNTGVIGQMTGTLFPDNQPSKDGKPKPNAFEVFLNSFAVKYTGAKGSTGGSRYMNIQNEEIKKSGMDQNELKRYYGVLHPASKDLLMNDIKEKKYTDSIAKALEYLDVNDPTGLSKAWRTDKAINERMKANGDPSNPMFELNDEQARVLLTLKRLADYPARAQVLRNQNPWLDEYYKKSSDYWDNILIKMDDQQRKQFGVDTLGAEIPKATPDMQKKLDQLGNITSNTERAQFYADNPDVIDFYDKQDKYKRFKDAAQGLPLFDPYPTANKETQSYIDEYNALPKGEGPLKKNGQPSSPTRSAWIKNNPGKWAVITDQWTKQDIYRLQKEGSLAVFEGVDFTEQGIKSIKDIAKALGMSEKSFANSWANWTPVERQYLTDFLNQIQPPEFKKITGIKAKDVKQYKIKLPSTTRRGVRIRLK